MPISEADYLSQDAIGLAEMVRSKQVTPAELLEVAIRRAERLNPTVNFLSQPLYELGRAEAATSRATGRFAGVPFLLKDLRASYKGVPTSGGSAWTTAVPDFDSDVTRWFREAGLVIFGKTNLPELGLSIDTQNPTFGPTRNPWDTSRSAGGSSGGSAAAVACRVVPAAHASDGGGSTRVPSSNCGTFGLKTSRGRVTYGPDVGEELMGMSTQHATTLSVRDSAALLDIDSQPNYGDPYWAPPAPAGGYLAALDRAPGRLRIALCLRPPNGVPVKSDCAAGAEAAARLCEQLGHAVEPADPGIDWADGYGEAFNIIFGVGMLSNVQAMARRRGETFRPGIFQPGIQSFLDIGARTSGPDYYAAVKRLQGLSRRMAAFHESYDVLLTPTLTTPPLPLAEFNYADEGPVSFIEQFFTVSAFMPLANASGQPAMTVPLHRTPSGLPVGVQFMARFGSEDVLLRLARQLEEAQPWFGRWPDLAAPV